MPIALSEDQKALAEAVTAITARHASKTATRAEFEDLAAGIWPLSWRVLVDQRLLGLHLPEEAGGDGAGLVELAILLEETAFGLLPGPLLPTVLTSLLVSRHGGAELRDRLLPALRGGRDGRLRHRGQRPHGDQVSRRLEGQRHDGARSRRGQRRDLHPGRAERGRRRRDDLVRGGRGAAGARSP